MLHLAPIFSSLEAVSSFTVELSDVLVMSDIKMPFSDGVSNELTLAEVFDGGGLSVGTTDSLLFSEIFDSTGSTQLTIRLTTDALVFVETFGSILSTPADLTDALSFVDGFIGPTESVPGSIIHERRYSPFQSG